MVKKTILPIMMFFMLLFGMAYFPYLPMELFNINYDAFSEGIKILYMLCCDIGFMIIIFTIYRKSLIKDFKEYFKKFRENFDISFKYYFAGLIIMIVSNLSITLFFSGAQANNEDAVRSMINLAPLYMIFSVSIYAPFVEELIFRKSIKDGFFSLFENNKFTKFLYIFISGLIFSSLHVIGMTNSYLDYLYIIPYLGLGASFAALYYRTDNIFSSISMHSLHNTVAIILYLVAGV